MNENKPISVGRIVLYVPHENSPESNNGVEVVPAIIVRVWGTAVNLKVFNDASFDTWKTSVMYSEKKEPGTWHWPEIVVPSKETTHETDAEGNQITGKSEATEEGKDGNGGNHPGKPGNP